MKHLTHGLWAATIAAIAYVAFAIHSVSREAANYRPEVQEFNAKLAKTNANLAKTNSEIAATRKKVSQLEKKSPKLAHKAGYNAAAGAQHHFEDTVKKPFRKAEKWINKSFGIRI